MSPLRLSSDWKPRGKGALVLEISRSLCPECTIPWQRRKIGKGSSIKCEELSAWILASRTILISDSNRESEDTKQVRMRPSRRNTPQIESTASVIVPFPVPRSDVGLVTALRAGHVDAVHVLCDRHSGYLLRVAARILGPDDALTAVVAEALHSGLHSLDQLKDARALRAWFVARVVVAARNRLKTRRRLRWFGIGRRRVARGSQLWSDQLLATYRILDRMNDVSRIVYCLGVIHSMGLADVAVALGLSLSQVRSALDKACSQFSRYVVDEPSLLTSRKLRSA